MSLDFNSMNDIDFTICLSRSEDVVLHFLLYDIDFSICFSRSEDGVLHFLIFLVDSVIMRIAIGFYFWWFSFILFKSITNLPIWDITHAIIWFEMGHNIICHLFCTFWVEQLDVLACRAHFRGMSCFGDLGPMLVDF